MKTDAKLLLPENSAQGTNTKPNPFVRFTLELLTKKGAHNLRKKPKIVDLGCGKLRHLKILTAFTNNIILVDTNHQINRVQKFEGTLSTMKDYVKKTYTTQRIRILGIDEFEDRNENADIIYSVAVMDAVLKKSRVQIVNSACSNLRHMGFFVVIVPRNDSSILEHCKIENKFEDGYFIRNRGQKKYTFYANFRDHLPLLHIIQSKCFKLIHDNSTFRHICWIFQKT